MVIYECKYQGRSRPRAAKLKAVADVSKNEEYCIKNEECCIKNDEFCIKNEECCIKNEECCIQIDELCRCSPMYHRPGFRRLALSLVPAPFNVGI